MMCSLFFVLLAPISPNGGNTTSNVKAAQSVIDALVAH
jgi:hypothetical protein